MYKLEKVSLDMMGGGKESTDPILQRIYCEARKTMQSMKVGESFVIRDIPPFARVRVYSSVYIRARRMKIKITCQSRGLKENEMRVYRKE